MSSTGSPLVSVIIPACNAGRTIDAAVGSVLAQTFTDFEVIVVDDGSTDDTSQRVAEYAGRVVHVSQPHGGAARARNNGLRCARGRLIAFLDADHVWLPRKLERQAGYFAQFPDTGMLHGAALTSAFSAPAVVDTSEDLPFEAAVAPPGMAFADIFHGDVDVNMATVVVRRDVFEQVGLFDERPELQVADWDLWLRISAHHLVGYLPVPLAVRPPRTIGSRVEKTYRGRELVIEKHAPLCAAACDRHRGDAETCVRERRRRLRLDLADEQFWNGRMAQARAAYRQALGDGFDLRSCVYYTASFGVRPLLQPIRRAHTRRERQATAARAGANLVHDTALRRTRRRIVDVLHNADDTVSRFSSRRTRILFEAASPMSLAIFRPVYDRLRRDPRIEIWFTTSDAAWTSEQIFRAHGVTDRVIAARDAKWMKFDAYVNADFWNMTWLPRRTRRVHLFHGVAGKYGLDAPVRIAPVVASFDRLLFPNRDRLRRYARAGLVDAESPRAALVGYPKVDCLVDGSLDRRAIQRELGLDPLAPTVMYAPTWSPYSSLNRVGEALIATLARTDANVIVKLHDRSLDATDRGSGGVDWRSRLERLAREYHVHVAEHADASPYMVASDLLVTDHSSVGFEFMLLDRPIVVVDCPELVDKARINPEKVALLRSAADVAVDAEGVAAAVARSLAEPARHGERRRAISSDLFYGAGGAAQRAVECIYDLLLLPLPEPAAEALAMPAALPTFEARTT